MLSEGDDLDHEQTYVNSDVKSLTQAWINERCSPELLPYEGPLITNLIEMLDAQVCVFMSRSSARGRMP